MSSESQTERDTHARPAIITGNAQATGGVAAAAGTQGSATGLFQTGTPFGRRYHLIRQLGVGGMGAVYQAWDDELAVVVAIKVIRPEAMADPAMARDLERRFKRELLLARNVTHKNVVRIHDLGRDRRHQVHHDAVRERVGPRDRSQARGAAPGCRGRSRSRGRLPPASSPHTMRASCTAT